MQGAHLHHAVGGTQRVNAIHRKELALFVVLAELPSAWWVWELLTSRHRSCSSSTPSRPCPTSTTTSRTSLRRVTSSASRCGRIAQTQPSSHHAAVWLEHGMHAHAPSPSGTAATCVCMGSADGQGKGGGHRSVTKRAKTHTALAACMHLAAGAAGCRPAAEEQPAAPVRRTARGVPHIHQGQHLQAVVTHSSRRRPACQEAQQTQRATAWPGASS